MSEKKGTADLAAEEKEGGSVLARFLYDWLGAIALSVVVILLLMTFFVRQFTVNGHSMDDTLDHRDRLLVSSFMYQPSNGDIVVITHGESLNEPIIKRVIAVGGQHLQIDYAANQVIVDGKVLNESYAKGRTIALAHPTEIPDVIPEGYVFVMGDNREDSLDSRSVKVGLIPVENIIGKAFWRIQPFDAFGSL